MDDPVSSLRTCSVDITSLGAPLRCVGVAKHHRRLLLAKWAFAAPACYNAVARGTTVAGNTLRTD